MAHGYITDNELTIKKTAKYNLYGTQVTNGYSLLGYFRFYLLYFLLTLRKFLKLLR